MTSHSVDLVHVVVPARDEEGYLPRTLDSLRSAVTMATSLAPDLEVHVTVVLDSCRDGSADVVRREPWVAAVEVASGLVGEVRAIGVEHARAVAGDRDPSRVWIACTDADTVVPPRWLVEQITPARQGYELVVGTVRPDSADLSPETLAAWESRHELREGHAHVHGANLGFTLAAYDRVGGFEHVRSGEDVRLVRRMQQAGVRWRATTRTQVVTSGRRVGRVPDGFSTYLLELSP